jgi:hypothetical protein
VSRLARLVVAASVFTVAVVPVAEQQPAPAVPVLASYTPSTATGHEWDQLVYAVAWQRLWYGQVATQVWKAAEMASRPVQRHTGRVVASHGGARDCVANTENAGDYGRSSNPGHFGRYQFSRPAWIAFGGNPDTWGSASPDEQDRVFDNAWSQGPTVQEQQWLRWDGC